MRRSLLFASLAATAFLAFSSAHGQVITFEQTPGGLTPVDNSFLAVPYPILGGSARFFFDQDGDNNFDSGSDPFPVFELAGPDGADAFTTGLLSTSDTAYPAFAAQLGSYFLRHMQPGAPPPPLIVDYNTGTPINALSGEIWDIDGSMAGTEQWQVDVLDAGGTVLATQLSPLGTGGLTPLDGRPWTFMFTSLPGGVDKVRLTFVGTKLDSVGLAFNNFSPFEAVPEPSSVALAIMAALVGGAWMWKRRG